MKKLHLILLITLSISGNLVLAQTKVLDQYFKRATTHKLIGPTNTTATGYLFGTYRDMGYPSNSLETAVFYDSIGAVTVNEVLIYFGYAAVSGKSDSVSVYVYDADINKLPSNVLGSGKVAVKDITCTNLQPTAITIRNGGAKVTGPFFVSFSHEVADDTIGVYSNDPATHDGKGEGRTKGRCPSMSGCTWNDVSKMWGGNLDCDAYIIPVIGGVVGSCKTNTGGGTGVADPIKSKGLALVGAFPNPAIDETSIHVILEEKEKVSLKVFDILGNTVFESNEVLQTGTHQIKINTSIFSTGNYYYTISTEQTQMTSKFVILKE